MEENTIFNGTPISPQNINQSQNLAQSADPKPFSTIQSGENIKSETNYGSSTPPASGFDLRILVKVILGIIFIAVLIFIISKFILPKFENKKNKESVVLSYWGLWEENNVMKVIISEFERENPSIKINYTKQDIKEYRERLTARIQNGTGPDIFRIHSTWLPMFLDVLVPLPKDVISNDEFKKWFYPAAQSDLTKNGAIYAIPLHIDTLALFVNTELFKAAGLSAPKTWDDFSKFSRELTVKESSGKIKTSGAAMGTFGNVTHAPDIISLLFIQNGVDLKNFSATQNVSDALDYYTHFARSDSVWDESLDPSILAFAKGNLAMYFGYSWDVFTIKALNPALAFQIHSVPHLSGRDITIASYWAESISVKSKYQKEAMIFLKFLSRLDTEQKLFSEEAKLRLFGEPYARMELADSLKTNNLVYPFVQQGGKAVSSFFTGDTMDNGLNSQMNAYLQNAVNSVLSNTSPQTAADVLSKGVNQVLKQYGQ